MKKQLVIKYQATLLMGLIIVFLSSLLLVATTSGEISIVELTNNLGFILIGVGITFVILSLLFMIQRKRIIRQNKTLEDD